MSKIIKKEAFDTAVLIRMNSKMKKWLESVSKNDRRSISDWMRLHFEELMEKTEKNV